MRLALLILAALCACPAVAGAYPQFQLSTGNVRCNQCHYAPAGGGILRTWGREEAADTISRSGGDGAFLHGAWEPPDWLELGGDVRLAGLVNDVGGTAAPEFIAFPMQLDVDSLFKIGQAWTVALTVGARGAARDPQGGVLDFLVSREHWVMWQPKTQGPYVRAGRFFAPHGMRFVEHPAFVRRFMGFGVLEETYNVSGGWVKNDWELHLTAFTPDFLRPIGWRGRGVTALYERRGGEDDQLTWGLQTRLGWADSSDRFSAGGVGKYWLEDAGVLLMGEANLVAESIAGIEADDTRLQVVSFLGAAWFLADGIMLQGAWEHFDEDVAIRAVSRDALTVQAHYFPRAHFELLVYSRLYFLAAGQGGDTAALAMLQLHYYL